MKIKKKNIVVITNDHGVRRGSRLVHGKSILWNMIHDWNSGDVLRGEKKVMIVER